MCRIDTYYVASLFNESEHWRNKLMAAKISYQSSIGEKTKIFWQKAIEWAKNELNQTEQEIEEWADQMWENDKPYTKF